MLNDQTDTRINTLVKFITFQDFKHKFPNPEMSSDWKVSFARNEEGKINYRTLFIAQILALLLV